MTQRRPYIFFVLTGVLSLPFWGLGAVADRELLPSLPVSALMVLAPGLAASVLVCLAGGRPMTRRFWRESVAVGDTRPWVWIVALCTMPLVMVASGAWLLAVGESLPPPKIDPLGLLLLFALFLLAAMAEELGWTGYASRPLYKAHGLIVAGFIIGVMAMLWHIIPLLQAGRSWDWIAWWSLGIVARRAIILWLYIHGGQSMLATALFHAMGNLSWMMFPVMGSHYHAPSVAVILVVIAVVLLACPAFERGGYGRFG
ncbi:CPBP family intramembrane metalloprotease [Ruegeria sp. R13_0]|uniref:CPBP family glutamic-type intramembrane protease n=1 Tax=Ruegeria sp. R13_0 TaxID=2821099 RepID=UPI001ADC49BD|nr:CPBP family glutamic-type intramembrane protease [Ruegeria sp. R13_0]MBO9437000.1 CPBP family intramembrane metalloprotease [Ruegeria sp. R13_0]